jgi:hypothetical protein
MKCSSGDDCGGANAVRNNRKHYNRISRALQMLVFDAACSGSTVPNYQECISPESKLHKFCDATLSAEDRLADLLLVKLSGTLRQPRSSCCGVQGLSLSDKVSLVSPDPTYGKRTS